MNRPLRRVGLFLDWNSQILATPPAIENNPIDRCHFALKTVGKKVTKLLCALDEVSVFRVRIRLYHGWTMGTTQTENRRAFCAIPEYLTPDDIFPSARVLALSDIEFGDRLIDALQEREISPWHIHLPNTLRRQRGDSPPVEKMVDTALASDLLTWARYEPKSIALVFSGDDDIVPPVFVAESWMKPLGGLVLLIRPPARASSRYLSLEGLLA